MSQAKKKQTEVVFMSINAFKKALGIQSFDVVYNENTGKLSVLDDCDQFYRCQQDIDLDGNLSFLLEKGKDISEACLVNVSGDGKSPLERRRTF